MSSTAQPTQPPGDTQADGAKKQTFRGQQLTAAERFVAALTRYIPDEEVGHRGNRAALAALRRALGKPIGEALDAFPYVVPLLPSGLKPWDEQRYYLVASLFALNPRPWLGQRHQSLGLALRLLARSQSDARSGDDAGAESDNARDKLDPAVERRFVALLNASGDGLTTHLRHAVTLLNSHDQRIDWAQLLSDMRDWEHPDRWVQRRWAHDFWTGGARDVRPSGDDDNGAASDVDDAIGGGEGDHNP